MDLNPIALAAKARGDVKIERHTNGVLVEVREVQNLVVDAGLAFIASRMKDASATVMSHMALGSGATAAAAGDTTLVTELGRVVLTSTNVAANTVVYTATFPAGTATGAVQEAGLFNAGVAGTMLARTVFSTINKGALDSITVTWTVTIS